MRRLLLICITLLGITVLAGCGGSGSDSSGGTDSESKNFSNGPDIDQLPYVVEESIYEGERFLGFSYENNSDFVINGVAMTLKIRDDAEDLGAFSEIKSKSGLSDQELRDGDFYAGNLPAVLPGEKGKPYPLMFDDNLEYYLEKQEQYDLLRPDTMTINYKDGDAIYKVYYDCVNDKMGEPEKVEDAYVWPKSEYAKKLPVLAEKEAPIVSSTDYGDNEEGDRSVFIDCYPATEELYDKYIEMAKEAGFTKELNEIDEIAQLEDESGDFLQISYSDDPRESVLSIWLEER